MDGFEFQKIFSSQKPQKELVDFLKTDNGKKILLNGLYASSKVYAFADAVASLNKGIHIVVMNNKDEAQFFSNDLYNILGEEYTYYFPTSSHYVSKISTSKDSSQKVQRSAAINALESFNKGVFDKKFIVLVTYPGAVHEKIINKKKLSDSILGISVNDILSHEFIKETLLACNFEKVDFVSEPGQFALRGGIIDVFSFSDDKPYRIDFFGNNIESIKHFDINTQRSIYNIDHIDIFPNI